MLISVVICSYRRPDRVDLALASLCHQTGLPSTSEWEILVVENDAEPSETMAAVCRQYLRQWPVRHIVEPQVGLSHARNTAVREAHGDYVAYLDDDAEAEPDWLAALVECCRKDQPDFCGGPSYPLYRSPKPDWFLDRYATTNAHGDQPRWLVSGEWLGGMNFVVNRQFCERLGGFRVDLGMTGNMTAYGEETELMARAWAANPQLKVRYLPKASVRHEVRPEKMTLRWKLVSAWAGGSSSTVISPLTRPRAVIGFLGSVWRLIRAIASLRFCFGRDASQRLRWQQWVYEEFRDWLWNFSRLWHGLFERR